MILHEMYKFLAVSGAMRRVFIVSLTSYVSGF